MDSFSGFTIGPSGPYTRSLALTPELGEFEPTTAIYVNAQGTLTMVLAGDADPVSMYFDYASRGLFKFRVKQVISFVIGTGEGGTDVYADASVPPVVGLY
jgi:hypothetical protein